MLDDDLTDEEWIEDDGDEEDDLLLCPSCRGYVHEDTQQCPHCGDWITPVDPDAGVRRWVWAVAALLVIAAFVYMTVR